MCFHSLIISLSRFEWIVLHGRSAELGAAIGELTNVLILHDAGSTDACYGEYWTVTLLSPHTVLAQQVTYLLSTFGQALCVCMAMRLIINDLVAYLPFSPMAPQTYNFSIVITSIIVELLLHPYAVIRQLVFI